jgi:hypothetical protein
LDWGDRLCHLAENRLLKQWECWVPPALHTTYDDAIALPVVFPFKSSSFNVDRHNLPIITAAIAFYKVTEMMGYAIASYEIGDRTCCMS